MVYVQTCIQWFKCISPPDFGEDDRGKRVQLILMNSLLINVFFIVSYKILNCGYKLKTD